IRRTPRGLQPSRRTMLVVTAVSSINTWRAVSSQPCSRIQRRRARATSARLRSSACRLFFEGDAMASKKSRQRATASWNAPFVQCRSDLIQREVWMLADQGADLLRIPLQRRRAPSARHRFGSPLVAQALHPADCRTGADLKLFGRFTSRSSCLDEVNYANPQLTRIRSPHRLALWRINALDSLNRRSLGIPIHSGRDTLVGKMLPPERLSISDWEREIAVELK